MSSVLTLNQAFLCPCQFLQQTLKRLPFLCSLDQIRKLSHREVKSGQGGNVVWVWSGLGAHQLGGADLLPQLLRGWKRQEVLVGGVGADRVL